MLIHSQFYTYLTIKSPPVIKVVLQLTVLSKFSIVDVLINGKRTMHAIYSFIKISYHNKIVIDITLFVTLFRVCFKYKL